MNDESEYPLEFLFGNESMENKSLLLLGVDLFAMNQYEKAQQIFQKMKSTADTILVPLVQNVVRTQRMNPEEFLNVHVIEKYLVQLHPLRTVVIQCLKLLFERYWPDGSRRTLNTLLTQLDNSTVTDRSSLNRHLNDILIELEKLPQINNDQRQLFKIVIHGLRMTSIDDIPELLETLFQSNCATVGILPENNDDDQGIDSLKESVPLLSNHCDLAQVYEKMITIHEKEENWRTVIECCQNIINLSQLPPNSTDIFRAHLRCANAYLELKDEFEANISYKKASDLLDQHHRSNPSLLGEFHLKRGNGFQKMNYVEEALASYHQAIENDCLEIASEVYLEIGCTYFNTTNYDLARENLIKCVSVQPNQNDLRVRFWSLAAYMLLIKLEHKTGHHQQRNVYISKVREMCGNYTVLRDGILEIIQSIFNETAPIE
jgi:tetratricopeptide (TPR) repeat protein